MKKNLFIAFVITIMAATVVSCGNSGNKDEKAKETSQSTKGTKASKNVDVPLYALSKGNIFDEVASKEKKLTALTGNMGNRYAKGDIGFGPSGHRLYYNDIDVNDKRFHILFSNAIEDYLIGEKYLMHVLVNADTKNYPQLPKDVSFSDTYYFFQHEKVSEAIAKFNSTTKTENKPSSFVAKDLGGVKTYNAKIIHAVAYSGMNKGKETRFLSLYLECGAVVQLFKEFMTKNFIGKNIDCVTDEENNIVGKNYVVTKI